MELADELPDLVDAAMEYQKAIIGSHPMISPAMETINHLLADVLPIS